MSSVLPRQRELHQLWGFRLADERLLSVQRRELRQLVGGQRKVEQGEIFSDMLRLCAPGDDGNAYLRQEFDYELDHQEQVKARGDGMEATIKELCPNAEIVYRQKAESTEEGMNVAETALTAHPGIKVIACVNDQMAIGAWQAVQNLGLYSEDFYIGGGDNTSQIASYIADENCAIRQSVDIDPPGSGYNSCKMAYDILVNGKDPGTMEIQSLPTATKMYNPSVCEELNITPPEGYTAIETSAE